MRLTSQYPYTYPFYYSNPALLEAQEEPFANVLLRLTFSSAGEDDVIIEQDRIKEIPSQMEARNSQQLEVICNNSDGYFTNMNLKGYDAIFEWGLVTPTGDLYIPCPLMKVKDQVSSSAPGSLTCRFVCIGIPNRLALDKASKDYTGETLPITPKTVKALFTEVASGVAVPELLYRRQEETDGEIDLKNTTLDDTTYDVLAVGQRLNMVGAITWLSFKLKKTGSPAGNVTFRIIDATTKLELASATITAASVNETAGWQTASFVVTKNINAPLTFPGGVATGGVWIYAEHLTGDAGNYISVCYNSARVTPREWLVLVDDTLEEVEYSDLEVAYRHSIMGDGIDVYSQCENYTVVYDGEDALIDVYTPLDAYSIPEGMTRWEALTTLLSYTTCVQKTQADGKIHVFVPTTTGETYDSQYALTTGHTFFSKSIRDSLVIPNKITVHSFPEDDDQYTGSATSPVSYALMPVEDFIRARLTSDEQAEDIAEALIAQGELDAQRGAARVPLNLASEVYDYVLVTDERQSDTRTGNLGYINRKYLPGKIWKMEFGFGKLSLKSVTGTRPSLLYRELVNILAPDDVPLTYGDLRPILEAIAESFEEVWEGNEVEGYNGINDLIRNQAVLTAAVATLFTLIEDMKAVVPAEEQIEEALVPYMPLSGGRMHGNIRIGVNRLMGLTASIEYVMDGGGAVIPVGVAGNIRCPFAGAIVSASLSAEKESGSMVVDVWKGAGVIPTVADTITASAKPTLSSEQVSEDTTLTGWTTDFAEGDILVFKVDSCSTITRATLSLKVRRT